MVVQCTSISDKYNNREVYCSSTNSVCLTDDNNFTFNLAVVENLKCSRKIHKYLWIALTVCSELHTALGICDFRVSEITAKGDVASPQKKLNISFFHL